MGRYWSGRVKMLLLVGVPCIICSLVLGSMPRNIVAIKMRIDHCNKEKMKLNACIFDKTASSEFKIWFGVNVALLIITLYYGITHSINFGRCLSENGCCEHDGCGNYDNNCDCCESFDCYDACSDGCQYLDGFIYFYLISIGLGYYTLVDLVCYTAAPFLVTVTSAQNLNNPSMSPVVFTLGQYSGYASLCIGIMWILTLTVCLPCATSQNSCVRALVPVFGAGISFGLILIVIAADSQKAMEKLKINPPFEKSKVMTCGLILAFTNVICYLIIYFFELRRKHIQENNEQFDDSDYEYDLQNSLSYVTGSNSYAFESTHSPAEANVSHGESALTTSRTQISTFV